MTTQQFQHQNHNNKRFFWFLCFLNKEEKCFCFCCSRFPHLSEDERLGVAAVQAEHEADRLKEFLDAGAKLLLLHATRGPRVKDPRLDDELEQILQSLRGRANKEKRSMKYSLFFFTTWKLHQKNRRNIEATKNGPRCSEGALYTFLKDG